MWSEIVVYLRLGVTHIANFTAMDHMVFLLAMTVAYTWKDWKRVLWLVTAFTVGHSLTLLLATLELVHVNDRLVEILIAVTIALAALVNIFRRTDTLTFPPAKGAERDWLKYVLVFFFGLIHGLGFSNFLRSLLGAEESLLAPLLSFNIGLEIGQILIVAVLLSLGTLIVRFLGSRTRDWVLVGSGMALGIALEMIVLRLVG